MDQQIARKLMAVLEASRCDPGFLQLCQEYDAVNRQLLSQMDAMTESQRSAVLNYIGLCEEMHMKQLPLALDHADPYI